MPSDQSWNVEQPGPELRPRAQETERPGGPFEAISSRLDQLAEQLNELIQGRDPAPPEPAASQAPARASAPSREINETLTRLDRQLGTLMEQGRSNTSELETRIAAVDRALAALNQEPALVPEAQADPAASMPAAVMPDHGNWALGLDRAVAEITERQRMLDTAEAQRSLQQQFVALCRRLDDTAPRPAQSLAGSEALGEQLRHLSAELKVLRQPGEFERGIETLRQELASIGRKLDDAAPRHAIQAIEAEVRTLSDRVEHGRSQDRDSPALARIDEVLEQVRTALTHFTPAETLAAFREDVRALDQKIEAVAANTADGAQTAATLRQLERAVADLGEVASHAASGDAMVALAEEVQAIGEKIDRLTANAGRERQEYTSLIDQRFQELANLLDTRAQTAVERAPGNITALMEQIAGQLERVEVSRDHSPMLDAIATQITRLTDHIEASESRLDTLEQFQSSARALLDGMEALRASSINVAEQAARQAVSELVHQLPAAGPEVGELRQDVDSLRQSHIQSERRTQDTLEAVHDTLERLVDRLALVETGLRSHDSQPDNSEPRTQASEAAEPNRPMFRSTEPASSSSGALPGLALAVSLPVPVSELTADERSAPPAPVDMDMPRPPLVAERRAIDPSLPADHPLEPGTATSRTRPPQASAAERIAASEAALGPVNPTPQSDAKANFIAAARRAAQAAANMASSAEAERETAKQSQSSFSAIAKRLTGRRPLLLGLLLLIGAGALHVAINGFGLLDETPPAKPAAVAAVPAKTVPTKPAPAISATGSSMTASQPLTSAAGQPTGPTLPMLISPPKAEPERDAAPAQEPQPRAETPATPAVSPLAASPMQLPGSDLTGSIGRATGLASPPSALSMTPPATTTADLPASFGKGLRNAALGGHPAAEYEVASRFAEGRGVTQNFEEAARWFERAAARGLAPAQYRLGSLYEKGQGVKKDIDQARRLYRSAADHGNAKAMHNLAVLYAEGIDGKPDLKLAAEWFRRAAARGIADSQYNLGILYARGLGVEQNLAESYKWFSLAHQQGDQDAGKKRDDVAARMDQQALIAAKLATQTFTAEPQPEEAVSVKPPPGGWDAMPSATPAPAQKPPAKPRPKSPVRPKPALAAPQNIKPS